MHEPSDKCGGFLNSVSEDGKMRAWIAKGMQAMDYQNKFFCGSATGND